MRDIARQFGRRLHIGALIPAAVFRPGFFLPDPPRFVIDTLPLSDTTAQALRDLVRRKGSVAVHLDKRLALQRTVTLPQAVAGRAGAAIDLQMRQTLPAMANGLVWQAEQTARSARELVFTVYVMKEDVLRQMVELARNAGGAISEIRFSGVAGAPLLSTGQRDEKSQRWAITATGLGIVALAAWAVWGIEADVTVLQSANAAQAAMNAALEERLVALTDRLNDVEGLRADLLADLAAFDGQSGRLQYWSDLTRDLPDRIWISEFSVDADSLSLSGFSEGDATEVVEILQQQSWAGTVRLEGPIQFDSYTRQNRFVLAAELKAGVSGP
jgi:Tfp pilus assembly protein PilN